MNWEMVWGYCDCSFEGLQEVCLNPPPKKKHGILPQSVLATLWNLCQLWSKTLICSFMKSGFSNHLLQLDKLKIWENLNIYSQQESPPAWTQEAYPPPRSKSSNREGVPTLWCPHPDLPGGYLPWPGRVPTLDRGYLPWGTPPPPFTSQGRYPPPPRQPAKVGTYPLHHPG